MLINNWNGDKLKVAKSKGKSKRRGISVYNYEDNLIIPDYSAWPHPDILKKLYKSGHSRAFDEQTLTELSQKLGFYCDLQSLRSEDAITWSVFGTLYYFPKAQQIQFINSLLEHLDSKLQVNDCSIQLWTRIVHPDTLGSGGPELDFLIVGDKLVLLGEAKWTAKVAKGQGKKKDKDQLQLRMEFSQKYDRKIFPHADKVLVLFVSNEPEGQNHYDYYISWETICNKTKHPLKDELSRYYSWKMKFV